MKSLTKLFLIVVLGLIAESHAGSFDNKGILKYPVKQKGETSGEPGQTVHSMLSDSSRRHGVFPRIDLQLNGEILRNIPNYRIIPYDSTFSMSRAYLLLQQEGPVWSHDVQKEVKYRYLLANNILEAFPAHPLYEEVFALLCDYAKKYESYKTYGMTRYRGPIALLKAYLRRYPDGTHRDRLEWKLVQLQHHIYEFEGVAKGPMSQAQAFENYLSANPKSKVANDIKLMIAKLYRIAHECVEYAKEQNIRAGFTEADGERFLERSLGIYEELLESEEVETRETARVALYNIRHNRRVSLNSNEW